MEYNAAYLYLFNKLTDLMQRHPVLREEVMLIQQRAEEIILFSAEDEA